MIPRKGEFEQFLAQIKGAYGLSATIAKKVKTIVLTDPAGRLMPQSERGEVSFTLTKGEEPDKTAGPTQGPRMARKRLTIRLLSARGQLVWTNEEEDDG